MKTCSVHLGIRTETKQRINAVHCTRGMYLCLFIFDYKALLVCVKDRTCLRIAIVAYCFNIFGSISSVLFCLLIKKLILGCKTIWQSMRSVSTLPHMDKEEAFFFLKTAYWHGQNFLDDYLFIRSENLKTSLKFSHKLFWENRLLLCPNDIQTLWLLIAFCNMSKGLVA